MIGPSLKTARYSGVTPMRELFGEFARLNFPEES